MRYITIAATCVLLCGTACTPRWGMLRRQDPPAAELPKEIPSAEQLVAYLNDNAKRIDTLRCTDVDMTVTHGLKPWGLRGMMVAEKSKNFRMSAKTLGKQVVDLGSNEQEFWYWVSKSQPPYQFYCSYKDLEQGNAAVNLPFQPQWIMETLGFGPYGPAERYKVEVDGDRLKLVERTRSPQGAPVRKEIVFRRRPARGTQPQVLAYVLVDEGTGREICSAHISEVMIDPRTNAIVPRKTELRWPGERLKLSMRLGTVTLNSQMPQTAFVRPERGFRSYNLAQRRGAQSTSLRRVQHSNIIRNRFGR